MIRPLHGAPFVDLGPLLDLGALAAIDEEICVGLSLVGTGYTGGSHRSMGIVPPSLAGEPYADYGEVIRRMSRDELAQLLALGEHALDVDTVDRAQLGEEREHPLSRQQMRLLEVKYGVYFPWKAYYELIPNGRWDEKSVGIGQGYTDEARRVFPRTIAFVEALPFVRIGRCNLLGLAANDHGTVHRDGDPDDPTPAEHFITVCPRGDKRLFLWDEARRQRTFVRGRAYWFDDRNYHGVAPDPFFRYSLRVDGVFTDDFLAKISLPRAA